MPKLDDEIREQQTEEITSQPIQWHARTVDKALKLFKVKESGRAETQQLLTHPVVWAKGEGLPEGVLAPWEKMLFALHAFMGIAAGGYGGDGQRKRLWNYTYGINPNHLTVGGIILSIFDAVNDPFIGQWMDRRPMLDKTYRKICRTNNMINVFLSIFFLFDFGFSSFQRVAVWTGVRMLMDILSTMSEVAYTKYFVGITPFSDQRGKTMVWQETGGQFGWPIANIPAYLMGFARDRQQWSDYRVFTRGALITLPLALGSSIIHTFARNRVKLQQSEEITAPPRAPHEEGKESPYKNLSLKEKMQVTYRQVITAFGVLRHNPWLISTSIANFIKVFTPRTDEYPIYRWLIPPIKMFGREFRGEAILPIRNQLSGTPITFLYPFMGKIVNKIGGPKRTHIYGYSLTIAVFLAKYFIGYKGPAALIMIFIGDLIWQTIAPFIGYSSRVLEYEMLDVVEYETGVRSEGVTMAFKALFNKILTSNIDSATGNWLQGWTGINQIDVDSPNPVVPERFQKWAWTFFTLTPAVDATIDLITRLFLKYKPEQRHVIEAELIKRRELAQQAKAELEEAAEQPA